MINTLRWIAVVPATLLGWYIALFLGLLLHGGLDYFCPPEAMVSGMCMAW